MDIIFADFFSCVIEYKTVLASSVLWQALIFDWLGNEAPKWILEAPAALCRYTMVLLVHDWIKNCASKSSALLTCVDLQSIRKWGIKVDFRGSCHCPIVSIWLTFTAFVTIVAVNGITNMTTANTYTYILHTFSHEWYLVVLQIAWIQYKSQRHWVLHGTVLSIVSDTSNN